MLPLRAVEGSGRGGMSPGAARVKEEPGAAVTDCVVKEEALVDEAEVKTEPPCEDVVVKEEALVDEVEVKTEPPCEDGAGAASETAEPAGAGGASETAEPAGAGCGLDVKDEPDLGAVRVQARDVVFALRVAAVKQEGGQEPRDDCLRLLTGEKLHACYICGKYFLNMNFLHRHQQEHAGPEPVGVSGTPAQLNTLPGSNRVHADKEPYSCETCEKQFSQKYHLVAHRRTHTEKPYSGDVCSKKYSQKIQSNEHKRLRHGELPFTCEICLKPFVYLGDLRMHIRIHTGEKPYICKICKKQFNVSKNLHKHVRIHSGQKPYSCEICNKKFMYTNALTVHRRTHTVSCLRNL